MIGNSHYDIWILTVSLQIKGVNAFARQMTGQLLWPKDHLYYLIFNQGFVVSRN